MVVFAFIAYKFIIKYKEYLINYKIKSGELSEQLTKSRGSFRR